MELGHITPMKNILYGPGFVFNTLIFFHFTFPFRGKYCSKFSLTLVWGGHVREQFFMCSHWVHRLSQEYNSNSNSNPNYFLKECSLSSSGEQCLQAEETYWVWTHHLLMAHKRNLTFDGTEIVHWLISNIKRFVSKVVNSLFLFLIHVIFNTGNELSWYLLMILHTYCLNNC